MTEPVQGVAQSAVVTQHSTADERERNRLRHLYSKRFYRAEESATEDQVDISEEAHKKADGVWHRNILEHLESEE